MRTYSQPTGRTIVTDGVARYVLPQHDAARASLCCAPPSRRASSSPRTWPSARAGRCARRARAECDSGQDQALPAREARRGHSAKLDGEDHDQQEPQPEVRHRQRRNRNEVRHAVEDRVGHAPASMPMTDPSTPATTSPARVSRMVAGSASRTTVSAGRLLPERVAEVAAKQRRQSRSRNLLVERPVKAELAREPRDVLGLGVDRRHDLGRIPDDVPQHEDDGVTRKQDSLGRLASASTRRGQASACPSR